MAPLLMLFTLLGSLADDGLLAGLPDAVRATVEAHLAGGRVVEVEREALGGGWGYEVKVLREGRAIGHVITEAGTLVETEFELDVDEVPEAVLATLARVVPGGRVVEAERRRVYLYAVEVGSVGNDDDDASGADDDEREYVFSAGGWPVDDDEAGMPEDDDEDERHGLPDPVRDAIRREVGEPGDDADVAFASARPTGLYEVEFEVDGFEREVLVTEAGEVVRVEHEIAIDALPAEIRAAVARLAADGVIVEAERVERVSYELEVATGAGEVELHVSPSGRLH